MDWKTDKGRASTIYICFPSLLQGSTRCLCTRYRSDGGGRGDISGSHGRCIGIDSIAEEFTEHGSRKVEGCKVPIKSRGTFAASNGDVRS